MPSSETRKSFEQQRPHSETEKKDHNPPLSEANFGKIKPENLTEAFGSRTLQVLKDRLEKNQECLQTERAEDGRTELSIDDIRKREKIQPQLEDAIKWMQADFCSVKSSQGKKDLWKLVSKNPEEKFKHIINAMEQVQGKMEKKAEGMGEGSKTAFSGETDNRIIKRMGEGLQRGDSVTEMPRGDGIINRLEIEAIDKDPHVIIDKFKDKFKHKFEERLTKNLSKDREVIKRLGREAASEAYGELVNLTSAMMKNPNTKIGGKIAFQALNTYIQGELYKELLPEQRKGRFAQMLGDWRPAEWTAQNTVMVVLLGSLVAINYFNRGDPIKTSPAEPTPTPTSHIL